MDNQLVIARENYMRLIAILLAALLIILTTSFVLGSKVERGGASVPSETAQKLFPNVKIEAKSAYVYDVLNKKILYMKNAEDRLPLASLTKIMSALVALEKSPSYNTVTISDEALKVEGDSGLLKDEKWSLKNLLDFSLVTSSNDGMHAVALSLGALSKAGATSEEVIAGFVYEMNMKAKELGLKNTYFTNETGLDQSEIKGGAYGSARDIGNLMEYILTTQPQLFEATGSGGTVIYSQDGTRHVAVNTNDIAHLIPGLIASKTGYTQTAGGNLAIAFDPEIGHPFIITLLGSSEQGRFADMQVLIKGVMEYISH